MRTCPEFPKLVHAHASLFTHVDDDDFMATFTRQTLGLDHSEPGGRPTSRSPYGVNHAKFDVISSWAAKIVAGLGCKNSWLVGVVGSTLRPF